MDLFTLRSLGEFSFTQPLLGLKEMFSLKNPLVFSILEDCIHAGLNAFYSTISFLGPLILRIPYEPPCYVMQAVVSVNCLGDKSLLHAKLISTALTQLLIFRLSCLLTNKGIVQCIDNSN